MAFLQPLSTAWLYMAYMPARKRKQPDSIGLAAPDAGRSLIKSWDQPAGSPAAPAAEKPKEAAPVLAVAPETSTKVEKEPDPITDDYLEWLRDEGFS